MKEGIKEGKWAGKQAGGKENIPHEVKKTAQPKPRRDPKLNQSIASRAFFTSSMMSSIFSSPTEKRTNPGLMPAAASCSSVS